MNTFTLKNPLYLKLLALIVATSIHSGCTQDECLLSCAPPQTILEITSAHPIHMPNVIAHANGEPRETTFQYTDKGNYSIAVSVEAREGELFTVMLVDSQDQPWFEWTSPTPVQFGSMETCGPTCRTNALFKAHTDARGPGYDYILIENMGAPAKIDAIQLNYDRANSSSYAKKTTFARTIEDSSLPDITSQEVLQEPNATCESGSAEFGAQDYIILGFQDPNSDAPITLISTDRIQIHTFLENCTTETEPEPPQLSVSVLNARNMFELNLSEGSINTMLTIP